MSKESNIKGATEHLLADQLDTILRPANETIRNIRSSIFLLRVNSANYSEDELRSQMSQLIRSLVAIHVSAKRIPFIVLPDLSHLPSFLQISGNSTQIDENIPTLPQLLHPAGPLLRVCIETKGALDSAALKISRSFVQVHEVPQDLQTELQSGWQDDLTSIQDEISHLIQRRSRGKAWRRNPWWGAVPYRLMRSHHDIAPTPPLSNVLIRSVDDLRFLRRETRAFLTASRSVTLCERSLLALLGLSLGSLEDRFVDDQFDNLSEHRHRRIISEWSKLVRKRQAANTDGPIPGSVWSFDDLFYSYHVPNGLIAYFSEESRRWGASATQKCETKRGVRLRETGIFVGELGGTDMCASPAAIMSHRVNTDFWMWGPEDCAVIVNVEPSFASLGRSYSENVLPSQVWYDHNVVMTQSDLDVASWIHAQAVMHICGREIKKSHVVWYSVHGGMNVYEVWRDDCFLESLAQYVKAFFDAFVVTKVPPSAMFWNELGGQALLTEAGLQCKSAQSLTALSGDICELILQAFRINMNQWEKERSGRPFNS